jgi:phage gp29-like protein
MSSNAERENMVHKLIAVTGIDDADFARDLLHGNGWQLEPSVNAHPNEDAHSEDRLASINMNEMLDMEDRLKDMLDACA